MVTAKAPTYQTDSNPKANNLARSADQHPQVRYWSLCTTLKGRHTGDCLRDEQVVIQSGGDTFTAIVSPTCPVAGYANCLLAGPEPLQNSLAYRNLLPSPSLSRTRSPGHTACPPHTWAATADLQLSTRPFVCR